MRIVTVAVLAVSLAACGGAAQPSSFEAGDVSLRAWTTQPLPPPASFLTGPTLVIDDGVVITAGAVPAIYPGPLVMPLNAQPISTAGVSIIVRELQAAGLLADRTDFTEGLLPGGVPARIEISFGGASREIVGDPSRVIQCITTPCAPAPGTPEAFAAVWNRFYDLAGWLGPELGPQAPYEAERAAILIADPVVDPTLPGNVVEWPLAEAFAETGQPYPGLPRTRCLVVAGDDLATLRPAFEGATQLTRFRDGTGVERSLTVRWLTPGEPDPCRP